jgi:hypothetical protein
MGDVLLNEDQCRALYYSVRFEGNDVRSMGEVVDQAARVPALLAELAQARSELAAMTESRDSFEARCEEVSLSEVLLREQLARRDEEEVETQAAVRKLSEIHARDLAAAQREAEAAREVVEAVRAAKDERDKRESMWHWANLLDCIDDALANYDDAARARAGE